MLLEGLADSVSARNPVQTSPTLFTGIQENQPADGKRSLSVRRLALGLRVMSSTRAVGARPRIGWGFRSLGPVRRRVPLKLASDPPDGAVTFNAKPALGDEVASITDQSFELVAVWDRPSRHLLNIAGDLLFAVTQMRASHAE
ncbi:hypothetical protein SAMN04488557_1011 [Hyphomicrobium facile]|uniref:Uncharacterized protein n=1 Tax=Hyphomicrobium facile TaxID=51670 RepID=A0A1I7N1C5_9HYPH|nr:hypothetical protein SAMN04488557_1011 [Hyphomicrobium facile]